MTHNLVSVFCLLCALIRAWLSTGINRYVMYYARLMAARTGTASLLFHLATDKVCSAKSVFETWLMTIHLL